ncbi:hypothetical protein HHI36_012117 [Cryptolaemus montrouzieri]|uniref:Lipoprotein n=1 Tax=Cryptolaemus montrouzieri TaxID=559131 RepID=A0ABD2NEF6_9CUCU
MNNHISRIFISIFIFTTCVSYSSCDEDASYVTTSLLTGVLANALTSAKGMAMNEEDKMNIKTTLHTAWDSFMIRGNNK